MAPSSNKATKPDDRPEPASLVEVMDRIDAAGDEAWVSVEDIVAEVGPRSFSPLLLVPSILLVSPLSGIPGTGTVAGMIIAVIAANLVVGRGTVWLPGILRHRRVTRHTMDRALRWLRPPAGRIDAMTRPRLRFFTYGIFARLVGLACLVIALFMPVMEVVPMANSVMAAAVAFFALALLSHDGVLVLAGGALVGAAAVLIVQAVPFWGT